MPFVAETILFQIFIKPLFYTLSKKLDIYFVNSFEIHQKAM